jgi:hypothetical protein
VSYQAFCLILCISFYQSKSQENSIHADHPFEEGATSLGNSRSKVSMCQFTHRSGPDGAFSYQEPAIKHLTKSARARSNKRRRKEEEAREAAKTEAMGS